MNVANSESANRGRSKKKHAAVSGLSCNISINKHAAMLAYLFTERPGMQRDESQHCT